MIGGMRRAALRKLRRYQGAIDSPAAICSNDFYRSRYLIRTGGLLAVSTAISHRESSVVASRMSKPHMKFEVVVIPVSDVDRAKRFYTEMGWRLDIDFAPDKQYRVIQFTPPGSACSVIFGSGITPAAPGSAQGLYLIVSDIEAARADMINRG